MRESNRRMSHVGSRMELNQGSWVIGRFKPARSPNDGVSALNFRTQSDFSGYPFLQGLHWLSTKIMRHLFGFIFSIEHETSASPFLSLTLFTVNRPDHPGFLCCCLRIHVRDVSLAFGFWLELLYSVHWEDWSVAASESKEMLEIALLMSSELVSSFWNT